MVRSMSDLKKILDHFTTYPLLTKKRGDFELFAQIFKLVEKKEHLTHLGLQKIISIKAAMNFGHISEQLKVAFPDIITVKRPVPLSTEFLNLNINPQ